MRPAFEDWLRDLRHAVRALRRTPGFTIMAVGTLGLAIGVSAGMFSVVDTVLLHPLPYAHPGRLVYIAASAPGTQYPDEFGVGDEFYIQYKEQAKLLEDVSTYNSFTNTLRTPTRVERVRMSAPTYTLFSTLGAKPILGRLPTPQDESRVAVISYGLWTSWFGRDSSVIGRSYEMAGAQRTVIGVMGPDFKFPVEGTMLWIPQVYRAADVSTGNFGERLVARMAPGATVAGVARELTDLAKRLPERFGGSTAYTNTITKLRAVVRPLKDEMLGSAARSLWILFGAVLIVLLIACANVANLFLVRAEAQQRDLAVRRAIGAGRHRLIRLQMTEALVIAGLGGAVAIILAAVSLPAFLHAAPPGVPGLPDVHFGWATVFFTLAAALLSAVVCGTVPALRASAPDLMRLREGGRGATRERHVARDALVVGQTALALVLLVGSGLLVRSFWRLEHVNPGYRTENLFTFQIAPERPQLHDGPTFAQFDLRFADRLSQLRGVESVGIVDNIPLNEGTGSTRVLPEGQGNDAKNGILIHYTMTAGAYFKTMGIPLLKGRRFTNDDQQTGRDNVILSRTAADRLWPGQDPIGKRFRTPNGKMTFNVIGVVGDVMQYSFRDTPEALVYLPLVGPTADTWQASSPAYVIKTPRAETIAPEVRALVHEVAPEAPMYRVFTMARLVKDSMVQLSFTMLALGVAAALALILGAVGLYGVLSYVVAQRTREIGVRMALGAQASAVRRMVVVRGAKVVGIGVAIGLVVALLSTRALGSLLYEIAAIDVPTFVGVGTLMVAIGLLASYLPARRASSVDPVEALRGE